MSKMKSIMLSALVSGCICSANADVVTPESTGFKFTDTKVVKCTPIKDQYETGTCWCFSVVALMENEILRTSGKAVDLSEMYVVRSLYPEKAQKYMRMEGEMRFNQGGGAMDVVYAWDKYGMVPEDVYNGLNYGEPQHDHQELIAGMKGFMKGIVAKPGKRYSTAWLSGINGILDAYLGKAPEKFVVDGVEYTPKTYAASFGLNMADYQAYSSFTHHPFYEEFIIEIPDNWLWAKMKNVQLDEMEQIVDNAISNGYSVAWSADISEKSWQWDNGYAIMPKLKSEADMNKKDLERWKKLPNNDREKELYEFNGPQPEIEVTQDVRQQMFDSFETVDDHLMVIVGMAKDQKGNKFYKVKNSFGTNQIYDGYIYVSSAYFRAKTINIMVHKDGVPAIIQDKFVK